MYVQKRILAYLVPHRRILLFGLLCAAVVALITPATGKLIDLAFNAMERGDAHRLYFVCGGVVLLYLVKGVFSFGQNYFLSLTANRMATGLRDTIFAHLHSLSLSFFNTRRTGALMSVLSNDVPAVQNAAMTLRDVIAAPLTAAFCFVGLLWLNAKLTLVALIFIPFMAVTISRISKRIRGISRTIQDTWADLSTITEETLAGVRIIKSFSTETQEVARYQAENARSLKAVMRGVRKSALLRPITELIGAAGIALVLTLGGRDVARTNAFQIQAQRQWIANNVQRLAANPRLPIPPPEEMPLPPGGGMALHSLIQFIFLLNALSRSVSDIGGIATVRAQALAAAKRIFETVLDQESDIREKPDALPLNSMQGHIRFENVSFRYGANGPDVLRDVSFEVKPGEVVALVGRSGSGKSTLADLIPRFYDPTGGRITIDGIDLRDVTLDSLRRSIGIVPQETWLFAGTLRDNIRYGNRAANEEDVRAAAYAANAYFVENTPQGYDTVVGERGIRLSGGEKQRIAIARAILMNPRLLILDEATSSLDASSEALVQEALDELMKNRTTLVIAHRLSTIINADRILAMQDGQILEMGSHRELLAKGGYYARLYETQSRGFE